MKISVKDFFSKFDQIHSFLWLWSHLMKKSLMENFIFYAVHKYFKVQQRFFLYLMQIELLKISSL